MLMILLIMLKLKKNCGQNKERESALLFYVKNIWTSIFYTQKINLTFIFFYDILYLEMKEVKLMFMNADEVKEIMNQAKDSTKRFAMLKFKEQREHIMEHIISCAKAGDDECIEFLFYPDKKIENFVSAIYREEFERIAEYFFHNLGYQVSFVFCDNGVSWGIMSISWKE